MADTQAETTLSDAVIERIHAIVGDQGVLRDPADQERYVTDWRGQDRGSCALVVRPASTAEVAAVMRVCHDNGIPVTPQSGNTGMVSGAVPHGGIVLTTERMARIRDLDTDNATMTVEAGCVLASARQAADEADMVFPLSLASEGSCRIGGNLATNAGGNNTVRFGNTRDNVLGLEVVLPDGRVWDGLRALRKNNTGYDLRHLYIGSEGTLGIVTAAVFRLAPSPAGRETVLAACPDIDSVVRLFRLVRKAVGDQLLAFEVMPRDAVNLAATHVPGVRSPFDEPHPQYALFELSRPEALGGLRDGLETLLERALEDGLVVDAVLAESEAQAAGLWAIRESIPEAQIKSGGVIKHDVSVPVSRIPEFVERGTRLLLGHVPDGTVIPFGHIGDGNIHFNLLQPAGTDKQAFLAHMPGVSRDMYDLTVELGGSFSAEHGIGLDKVDDMERYRSDVELDLMRTIKRALDPKDIMNPGKILKPG